MIYDLVLTVLLAIALSHVIRLIYWELRPNVVEFDESILDGIDWSYPITGLDEAEWIQVDDDDEWQ